MNKYHNQKTEMFGITFDSKKEAMRYAELKAMQDRGEISNLEIQQRFSLLDDFETKVYPTGKMKRIQGIKYVADFCYVLKDGETKVAEDSKGFRTEVYKIKKKLFLNRYPDILFIES